MSSTYTLTLKFAPPGTTYVHPKTGAVSTSSVGHVWLEAREPDKSEPFSQGWSTGEEVYLAGKDNLSHTDWNDYREGNGYYINSITVNITKEQFEQLKAYPDLAATGKIAGFRSADQLYPNGITSGMGLHGKLSENHDTNYNVFANSCIDFAGQGLAHIGLAGKSFDGNPLLMPDRQIKTFLNEIAGHSRGDVTVRFEGKTHTLKEGEDIQKFWDKVAPNWDYVPYYMQNEPQKMQEMQYAQNTAERQQPSLQTAGESNPFLAYLKQNPVTPEDTERFMQSVRDYDNEFKEQEMMAMQQSRGRTISMS